MANLYLNTLILSSISVSALLEFAIGPFSSKPRGEEGGRVEVMLKIAYYLGGGDGSGLVDCYRLMSQNKGI